MASKCGPMHPFGCGLNQGQGQGGKVNSLICPSDERLCCCCEVYLCSVVGSNDSVLRRLMLTVYNTWDIGQF